MTTDGPIHVRTATADDLDTLVRFNVAMAEETEDRRLDEDVVRRGVARALADARLGRYYLAEREGEVVGQLLVTTEFSDWRAGVFWWIQSVYVAPTARQAGIYRALHAHVTQLARQTPEVCGLRLYVDTHNTRAQQVYRTLGMQRTQYELYETDWSGER